ncbi:hypothetical protein JB92DRAFT_3110281 [Gautieria morchelliformis]|nr:hypothetical protein JB92DRAFT_3110281 [Gautieria morchelliformis]
MSDAHEPSLEELERLLKAEEQEQDTMLEELKKEAWEAQEEVDREVKQKAKLGEQEKANSNNTSKAQVMNAEYAKQWASRGKLRPAPSFQQARKPNVQNEEWRKKPSMEEDEEVAKGLCENCMFQGDWCLLGKWKVETIVVLSSDNEKLRLKKAKGTPLRPSGSKPMVESCSDPFEGLLKPGWDGYPTVASILPGATTNELLQEMRKDLRTVVQQGDWLIILAKLARKWGSYTGSGSDSDVVSGVGRGTGKENEEEKWDKGKRKQREMDRDMEMDDARFYE